MSAPIIPLWGSNLTGQELIHFRYKLEYPFIGGLFEWNSKYRGLFKRYRRASRCAEIEGY
jgi:hypothetical protein